jgi:hypothetical protein
MSLDQCSVLQRRVEPDSGLVSHVLTERVAPLQQTFYFTNNGLSPDGRWLWFYCAAPPAAGRWLGVLNLETGAVYGYPETGFSDASPMVMLDGSCLWMTESALWQRGPRPDDEVTCLNELPGDLIGMTQRDMRPSRCMVRSATHLTLTADGRAVLIDAYVGRECIVGLLPLDGGPFELWHRGERCFNHGQMSPTDPDLALLAWDFVDDPVTGETTPFDNRLWLLRRGEAIKPVFDTPVHVTHEWWDTDGQHIWFVGKPKPLDDRGGTWRLRLRDLELKWMTDEYWHAHTSPDGRWLAGDRAEGAWGRGCASSVHLHDRLSGTTRPIISQNPEHLSSGRQYHIDPHPSFAADSRIMTYTTTVRDQVDVAIVDLAQHD